MLHSCLSFLNKWSQVTDQKAAATIHFCTRVRECDWLEGLSLLKRGARQRSTAPQAHQTPVGCTGISTVAQVTDSVALTEWATLFTSRTIWSRCRSGLPAFSPVGFCLKRGSRTRGWWARPWGPPSLLATRKAPAVCTHLHSLFASPPKNNEISHKFPEVMQDTDAGRVSVFVDAGVCFRSQRWEGHRASDAKDRERESIHAHLA